MISGMWTWLKNRFPLVAENADLREQLREIRDHRDQLLGQVEAVRCGYAQAIQDNAELRSIVASLDATCVQLSVQLYGQEAVARAIERSRRGGVN